MVKCILKMSFPPVLCSGGFQGWFIPQFTELTSLLVLLSQHPVVRNALFCLESAWNSVKNGAQGSHVYTKALLAYAFTLADNQEKRKEVLLSLHAEAVKEGKSTSEIFSPHHILYNKNVIELLHSIAKRSYSLLPMISVIALLCQPQKTLFIFYFSNI